MKINNTYDYLKYRAVVLSNERSELQSKLENNQIYIEEINNKIVEIKSTVNEGFEMFSPKAAEEKSFNKQEVKKLQMRLIIIIDENKEISKNIKKVEEELRIVSSLFSVSDNKSSDVDKSPNISETKSYDNNMIPKGNILNSKTVDNKFILYNEDDLANKLSFCKDIVELDPRRVKIEILNILSKKENG